MWAKKKNYARGGQLVTQKVWCLSVDITVVSVDITFARFPPVSHFGPIMPTTLGKTTPPGRISPDQAKEQSDAARRRARQSIGEYELIWLLQQRLRALSWPHWRLRCMQPLHGHGMGVVRP